MDQTNEVYSNDDRGRIYQSCLFHDTRRRVHVLRQVLVSHIEEMHYFFNILLSTTIGQTKKLVMMNKEGHTKVVYCMSPFPRGWGRGLKLCKIWMTCIECTAH